ncbi:hypothetical protein M885DRAFT_25410 [Pelagophyceae sp. CCMP2097]|nr:hypothetical protein M885DRAFT_25410 [Pelagophyceae sp. CCMP2097]
MNRPSNSSSSSGDARANRELGASMPLLHTCVGAQISHVAWSPFDHDELAVALSHSQSIYVYDVAQGLARADRVELRPAVCKAGGHASIAYARCEARPTLVCGGSQSCVRGWDRGGGWTSGQNRGAATCQMAWEVSIKGKMLSGDSKVVAVAACGVDSSVIVAATNDGAISAWDASKLQVRAFGHKRSPRCLGTWRISDMVRGAAPGASITSLGRVGTGRCLVAAVKSRNGSTAAMLDVSTGTCVAVLGQTSHLGPTQPEAENKAAAGDRSAFAIAYTPLGSHGAVLSTTSSEPDVLRLTRLRRNFKDAASIERGPPRGSAQAPFDCRTDSPSIDNAQVAQADATLRLPAPPTAIASHPDSGHIVLAHSSSPILVVLSPSAAS